MALGNTVSNALKFDGAGAFMLERLLGDGSPSKNNEDKYTAGQNLIGVINTGYNVTTEELHDENQLSARATQVTATNETVAIELRTEDPYLDLFLKGGRVIKEAGTQDIIDHSVIIPENSTYTLLSPLGAPVSIDETHTLLFRDTTTNEDYELVSGDDAPTAGQFKVDYETGVLTFAAEDKGKSGYLTAGIKMDDIERFQRDKNASLTAFKLTLTGKIKQYDSTQKKWVREVYDSVQITSGDISSLARQIGSQSTKTINFQVLASKRGTGSNRTYSDYPIDLDGTAIAQQP